MLACDELADCSAYSLLLHHALQRQHGSKTWRSWAGLLLQGLQPPLRRSERLALPNLHVGTGQGAWTQCSVRAEAHDKRTG